MCIHHYTDNSYLKIPLEKADRQDFYRELHKIADAAEPAVRRAILEAFDTVAGEVSINKLRDAIRINDEVAIMELLGITAVTAAPFINRLRSVFQQAAEATLEKNMPKGVRQNMRFDMLNPLAVDAIRESGAALVTRINETTRLGIRELIRQSFVEGVTPAQTARKIQNMVGLIPKHVKAVANYRALLISEGVKPAIVERRAEAYRKRLLRWRARNIARTETLKFSNEGQQSLWNQSIEQGLIDPNKTTKKWVVTPPDRSCPRCRAIPGNNTSVPVNGMFQTDIGPLSTPPLHPQCKCAVSLHFGG